MLKFLFAVFIFVVLIFPSAEVSAKTVGACQSTDSLEEPPTVSTTYSNSGGVLSVECPDEAACFKFKGMNLVGGGAEYNCYKTTTGAPPAAGVTTATGPSTSGSGQRCWLKDGQPFTLLPGQPIDMDKDTGKAHATGIYTAIGCIPTQPQELVVGLLKFATLASGGIAFLLMLLGALGMITAEGNPEAIKHSQEMFYSAVIGLLLIVFSVLLMQVIGVDVLGLPGFGG